MTGRINEIGLFFQQKGYIHYLVRIYRTKG